MAFQLFTYEEQINQEVKIACLGKESGCNGARRWKIMTGIPILDLIGVLGHPCCLLLDTKSLKREYAYSLKM